MRANMQEIEKAKRDVEEFTSIWLETIGIGKERADELASQIVSEIPHWKFNTAERTEEGGR